MTTFEGGSFPAFRPHFAGKCASAVKRLDIIPLAVTISRSNQLLITLVHLDVGYIREIMWPRNIQNEMFVLLCDLNLTPSASRVIALPTHFIAHIN